MVKGRPSAGVIEMTRHRETLQCSSLKRRKSIRYANSMHGTEINQVDGHVPFGALPYILQDEESLRVREVGEIELTPGQEVYCDEFTGVGGAHDPGTGRQ